MPRRSHQTLSCVSPCNPVLAKGTPLSVRTHVWSVTALDESACPFGLIAREPLVAGLPANAVAGTEVRHRIPATLMIGNELHPLVHGRDLLPGHRSSRERDAPTVECHPSCRNTLLPINPVCTLMAPNPALQLTAELL